MSRESLIHILEIRDGISAGDAQSLIEECAEELEAGNYEAIQQVLGLEDDYIFDVRGW